LLPVRQSIGQFLSSYDLATLTQGLQAVRFTHAAEWSGEARRLKEWVQDCIDACEAGSDIKFELVACDAGTEGCALTMDWTYVDDRCLHWRKFTGGSRGEIEAFFGKSRERIPTRIKPLPGEQALAEALFF